MTKTPRATEPAATKVMTMMTDKTRYLAVYTGPNGPISAYVWADSLSAAQRQVEECGHEWYDNGEDVLGLDPDSPTEKSLDVVLSGWKLVHLAQTDTEYSIYETDGEE